MCRILSAKLIPESSNGAISAIRITFENLRSLGFGSITGSYTGVGGPFVNPVRMIKISNSTDVNLLISFNGIDDQDFIAANSAFIYDYGSNKADAAGYAEQPAGIRVYVKQENAAPTTGNVYVTIIYLNTI